MKKLITICSATLLVGCTGVEHAPITKAPNEVTRTSGFVTKGIGSLQDVTFRTYQKTGEKNKIAEVTGAKCQIKGRGYKAAVTTPSIVRIPNYGKTSPNYSLFCQTAETAGTASGSVFNATLAARQNSVANAGAGGGILGALLTSAIASGLKEKSGDVWQYRTHMSVRLSPKEK